MSLSRTLSTLALCAIVSGGCAQHRVATSFAELEQRVKPGRTVYLTGTNGDVRKGKLERLTGTSAEVNVSGASTPFLERDTAQITVGEPVWHGAVIGAGIGALLGSYAEQGGNLLSECSTEQLTACESGTPVRGLVVGAGLGAAIGAGLDALVWKRTRIFAAPEKGGSVVLSPIAGPRAVGLRVTARF